MNRHHRSWILVIVALTGVACSPVTKKPEKTGVFLGPEAYASASNLIERNKTRQAKTILEGVQFTADNRPSLEPLVHLALADLLFLSGDDLAYIDARSKYLDFVTLFGEHPRAPYAQFQAGVCSLKQVMHPARDQAQTQVAIADLREVETRYPASPYAIAARVMIAQAEDSLAEHQFLVARFYVARKAWQAAIDRFRGILETYPRFRGRDKVAYHLGVALIRGGSPEEGRIYLDKLVSDDPGNPWSRRARRLLTADSASRSKKNRPVG